MKSIFKKIVTSVLMWEARLVVKKYAPTVIAVTGSVGKTSTKDAIFAMLAGTPTLSNTTSTVVTSKRVFVRKSDKSFNSEIGVPLTILGLDNGWNNPLIWLENIWRGFLLVLFRSEYPTCVVLEVGADHPGDIKKLTRWLKPDIAVITTVSKMPVHVEFFSSPAQVLDEKLSLARAVKVTGKLVLPATDPDVLAIRKGQGNAAMVPCLTFGIDCSGDVTATGVEVVYSEQVPTGMSFKLNYKGNSVPVVLYGAIGTQHIYALVAGAAAALSYGADLNSIVAAIATYRIPRGRMNILAGTNNSTLIDDTYNASPDAVTEALRVLASTIASRKIAVLGDMMELGTFSPAEHRKVGELAAKSVDMLVTVGIRARDIAASAETIGMSKEKIHLFDTSIETADFMKGVVAAGDLVLIKGSQSPRLERVTAALLAEPSRAHELLVRQEPEWLAKS